MRLKTIRKTHRWLGFLIGIQLLAWTVSGLYFSWNPIGEVRGEHLANEGSALAVSDTALASPGIALARVHDVVPNVAGVDRVTLRTVLGEPVYEIAARTPEGTRYVLADARTGALRDALTETQAVALARADFAPDAPVRAVDLVIASEPGAEYRGVTLPAYRVAFEHPSNTRLYVSVPRARVEARRNDTWRWFDWLWMLHIMDYDARDDFNHLLLQAFSVLGVVTVLSGFLLGTMTSPWLRRRRPASTQRRTDAPRDAPVRSAGGPPAST